MRSTFFRIGLASALALGTGSTALAQHGHGAAHGGGGGHFSSGHPGGGGHFSSGHFGGGRIGGSQFGGVPAGHANWGPAGRFGYGRRGYGRGYSYGPSLGYSYGSPYGFSYAPYYDYPYGGGLSLGLPLSAGWTDDYDGVPAYDYGVSPAADEAPPVAAYVPPDMPAAHAQPVTLTVFLPTADAELTLDGRATSLRGTERAFQSPPVEPGRTYHYTVTARWAENGQVTEQTQDVPMRAGEKVTVDFRGPAQ